MVMEDIGFCLEQTLAGGIPLPGQELRILLAFLGLLAVSYFDLFNRRNVPDKFLYGFFLVSAIANVVFFDACLIVYTLAIAVPLFLLGYLFYRLGQWGGADVAVILSIILLVPIHPSFVSLLPNYPFILSVLLFSFTLFALYTIVHFGIRLAQTRARADVKYLLFLLPYAAVIYLLAQLPLVSPTYILILSIAVTGSVFYMAYRQPIIQLLSEKLPLKNVEIEDILALERMEEQASKYRLQRLVTRSELARLRKLRISHLYVYTGLPPFLPFLLAGFVLALYFSSWLLF